MPKPTLNGVRVKIERANRHISDLESEIQSYFGRNPYRVIREIDPKTGGYIFRLHIDEDIPSCISGIIGDIVHNLRAALDQLVSQLVIANSQQPSRRAGFPIAASIQKFEPDAQGKLKGIGVRANRLIRRLKPYKGGNDFFWLIHELDRMDKHTSIIPVGAAQAKTLVTPPPFPWDAAAQPPTIVINPASRQYPLKDGTILQGAPARPGVAATVSAAGKTQSDIDFKTQFAFEIAFGEGQIIDGEPVLPALQQLADLVERVVGIFERKCI
jgi:hypothetical protein